MKLLVINSIVIDYHLPFQDLYILVLLLVTGVLIRACVKLRYPVSTTTAFVTLVMVLFITGLGLFASPLKDWKSVFTSTEGSSPQMLYLPGGLLFAAAGILLLKYMLRLKGSLPDKIIIVLPLIGIVQRIGCLLNGCCYGKTTGLPWGISYPSLSEPWMHQLNNGIIAGSSEYSHGVHPTQLYYILGYILVVGFLLFVRNRIRVPGKLALAGFMMLGMVRFFIEFYREPAANRWFDFNLAGMNSLQWLLMALLAIGCFFLWRKPARSDGLDAAIPETKEYLSRNSLVLLAAALITWNAGRLYDQYEYILLISILLIASFIQVFRLFQEKTVPALRYQTLIAIALTVLTMSQTIPDTTLKLKLPLEPRQWLSVKGNIGGGKYDYERTSCGGETKIIPSTYNFYSSQLAYHYMNKKGEEFKAGLTYTSMFDQSDALFDPKSGNRLNTFSPFVGVELEKFGMTAGLYDVQYYIPNVGFRFGSRSKFFVDMGLFNHYSEMGLPGVWQIGIGGGMGKLKRSQYRVGITSVSGKAVAYYSGNYVINNNLAFSTSVGLGNKLHGSFGLQYNLPLGKKPEVKQ